MKKAVDKVQSGKVRIVNARFAALTAYYLFAPDFCNVVSGWEKGIALKNVQDSRRRIWQDAGQHCFASFAEVNGWLESRCKALELEIPCPVTSGLTRQEALEVEQPHLMLMPGVFDGYIEAVARVSSTCLVTVKRNRCVDRLPESLHTSVEQVRHLATQVQANERPELAPIVTPEALQLNEVPIADTGRYDQLDEKFSPVCLAEEGKNA